MVRGKQSVPLPSIVETTLRQLSKLPRLNGARVFTVTYKLTVAGFVIAFWLRGKRAE
jgi:hypothetical protein